MFGRYYSTEEKFNFINNLSKQKSRYENAFHTISVFQNFEKSRDFPEKPSSKDVVSQFRWQAKRYQAALGYLKQNSAFDHGDACLAFHRDHLANVYQPLVNALNERMSKDDKNALALLTTYLDQTYCELGFGVDSHRLWSCINNSPEAEGIQPLKKILQSITPKKPLHPAIRAVIGGIIGLIIFGIIGAIVGAVLTAPAGGIGVFAGTLIGMLKGYTFGTAFMIGTSGGGLIGGAVLGGISVLRLKEDHSANKNPNTFFARQIKPVIEKVINIQQHYTEPQNPRRHGKH